MNDSDESHIVNIAAPAPDYTTPGQDYLGALQDELAEYNDGDRPADDAIRAIVEGQAWKDVSRVGRAVFERAALRFLSEGE